MSATKPWFEEATELLAMAHPEVWDFDDCDGGDDEVRLMTAAPTLLKAALEERERLVAALALVNERYVDALRQLGEAESKDS